LLLFVSIGFGLVLGASARGETGPGPAFYQKLASSDVTLAWAALQDVLETRRSRQSGYWRNGTTGNEGSVTPLRTYRIAGGSYCRVYRELVTTSGRPIAHTGTACRNVSGVWIPVEN
jgi:surface antigen